jgi:hypothetical protein
VSFGGKKKQTKDNKNTHDDDRSTLEAPFEEGRKERKREREREEGVKTELVRCGDYLSPSLSLNTLSPISLLPPPKKSPVCS